MGISITLIIIILTVVISIMAMTNQDYFYKLELSPYLAKNKSQWYRLFTHALIHAGWLHLFVNMYVLYSFGRLAEQFYGSIFGPKGIFYFLLLYVGGIMFSALPSIARHKDNPHYRAVGASGAVSAVLFASILFIPTAPIRIFLIPIDIPAVIFAVLYLAFEIYMDKKSDDHVAHDAHYWGAIFGVVFTIALKPQIAVAFYETVTTEFF